MKPPADRSRPALVPSLFFAILAGALGLHAAYYWPFLSDDALISLSYARRLAEGHGLTWTTGERVEGYTNFLWVVLLAVPGRFGVDYIWAARALDFLGALGAIACIGISPATRAWMPARLATGGLFLVLSAPMAVWSIGGLEHGFMAGVLAFGFLMIERSFRELDRPALHLARLSLAALVLLRADGAVLVGSALLGACLVPRPSLQSARHAVRLGIPALLLALGQLAFRKLYYGEWQPNTAVAKLAFNVERLRLGLSYLGHGYTALGIALVCALLGTQALKDRGQTSGLVVPWAVVIGWTLYLASVGGDIFPGWRQLVFVVVALAQIVATAAEQVNPVRSRELVALTLAGLAHLGLQFRNAENQRAKRELWEWDGLSVGTLFKQAFASRKPLLAVDAAGALPYWSELPSLDMLGLNDRYIARHPPATFGTGPIGHELGDGPYVLSRRPDLIAFNNASGSWSPLFLSGRQLLAIPEFTRTYQPIRLRGSIGNRARSELWLRREGGKLGLTRTPEKVVVPGYFFTGPLSDAVSRLDRQKRLVAELSPENPGILPALELPAGRYGLRFVPEDGGLIVGLRCGESSMQPASEGGGRVIELDQATQVTVALAPHRGKYFLSQAELLRDEPSRVTHRCLRSGDRLAVSPSQFTRKAENAHWTHPENAIFQRPGLALRLSDTRHPKLIEVSVDNNDEYTLEGFLSEQLVFRSVILPRQNGGGLAVHRIVLRGEDAPDGLDTLHVTPERGDGSYSVGHVRLEY